MASIFGIISRYKDKLVKFPTMTIVLVALTLLAYIIFRKKQFIKYVPGLAGVILGLVFLMVGFSTLTASHGLDTIWIGILLFTSGWIAIGTAWMLVLLAGIPGMGQYFSGNKEKAKKSRKPKQAVRTRRSAKLAEKEEGTRRFRSILPKEGREDSTRVISRMTRSKAGQTRRIGKVKKK